MEVFKISYKVIILAGGEGTRLKPNIWIPKPCLDLGGGKTLLEHQVEWLLNCGVKRKNIVISVNQMAYDYIFEEPDVAKTFLYLSFIIEPRKLGTGGAVRNIIKQYSKTDIFYAMNVDDLLFDGDYSPFKLLEVPHSCAAQVLTGFGRFPYGVVHIVNVTGASLIRGFEQKPLITDRVVSIGHLAFKRKINGLKIIDYLPERGNFEDGCLPTLAKMFLVSAVLFKGTWKTINTMKDLLVVRKYLENKK